MKMPEASVAQSDKPFVPWCDQTLIREESIYAVLNKLAWFVAKPCALYIRHIRQSYSGMVAHHPATLRYSGEMAWLRFVKQTPLVPSLQGLTLRDYLSVIEHLTKKETPLRWRSQWLRFCPECMASGVHLRLHQHMAVEKCPVHQITLQTTCVHCEHRLRYESSKEEPFCCPSCGRSLLRDGMIETQHTNEFLMEVSKRVQDALVWLGPANTDLEILTGVRVIHIDESHPLQAVGAKYILLEALCSARNHRPEWLRRAVLDSFSASFRALDYSSPFHWSHDSRGEEALLQWEAPVRSATSYRDSHADPELRWTLDLSGRYRSACRRVMQIFINRYRRRHPACLDTPYRMFGEKLEEDERNPDELLECCPVAIGFWLWRKTCSSIHGSIGEFERVERWRFLVGLPDSTCDLLFYTLVRSHLHYCVFVADECVRGWKESGATVGDSIEPILAIARSDAIWSCNDFDYHHPRMLVANGSIHFVKFDATQVFLTRKCPGAVAYQERLRRQLRNVRVVGVGLPGPMYVNNEDEWEKLQFKQERPFAKMKGDWIFFPVEHSPRPWMFDSLFTERPGISMECPHKESDDERLDQALNSKWFRGDRNSG